MMLEYKPRLIDEELAEDLEAFGAVQIVGPKWCGKTTTASMVAKSILKMQDTDNATTNKRIAELYPSRLLEGDNPRLIDEWQIVPQLWGAVRDSVDERNESGLYILTGSIQIDKSKIDHSGAGRIDILRMGTMSLFESGDSDGSVSLKELFDGKDNISGTSKKTLEEIAELITRGGWPKSIDKSEKIYRRLIKGYCENIIDMEISSVDGKVRDKNKMRCVLRTLSRYTSAPISKVNILRDIESKEAYSISSNTLNDYLVALRNIYILDELPAWSPKLRSKATIRSTDIIHFCDPAIATYFLSASGSDLMNDPESFGLLFESLVIRDLRTYVQNLGGEVFHYHDSDGLEVDSIIHLHNGKWAALEVKLGENGVEKGVKSLFKLKEKMDLDDMGQPRFMAVVTGSKYAYTREDGIHVIPITCLRN